MDTNRSGPADALAAERDRADRAEVRAAERQRAYEDAVAVANAEKVRRIEAEERADEARTALALSDKQHHDCIDKMHVLRAQIADAPHGRQCAALVPVPLIPGFPCDCWKAGL